MRFLRLHFGFNYFVVHVWMRLFVCDIMTLDELNKLKHTKPLKMSAEDQ